MEVFASADTGTPRLPSVRASEPRDRERVEREERDEDGVARDAERPPRDSEPVPRDPRRERERERDEGRERESEREREEWEACAPPAEDEEFRRVELPGLWSTALFLPNSRLARPRLLLPRTADLLVLFVLGLGLGSAGTSAPRSLADIMAMVDAIAAFERASSSSEGAVGTRLASDDVMAAFERASGSREDVVGGARFPASSSLNSSSPPSSTSP